MVPWHWGAKRDEVNLSKSNELKHVLLLRNSKQDEGDDQLFSDSAAGSKAKKRKGVVDELEEDAYVSVDLNGNTLHIKKAARANEDLQVPLECEQLKILFDYLDQPGTSALTDPTPRSYKKTGQFAGQFEKYSK